MVQGESCMSLRKDLRVARAEGLEGDDIVLELALGGTVLSDAVQRQNVELALIGDGTQAIPVAHDRRRSIDHDEIVSHLSNAEEQLIAKEAIPNAKDEEGEFMLREIVADGEITDGG